MIAFHEVDLEAASKLAAFARAEIGVPELEEWLVPHSMEADDLPVATKALLYEIELDLAELGHGHRSLDELRAAFTVMAGVLGHTEGITTSSSSSTMVPEASSFAMAGADSLS